VLGLYVLCPDGAFASAASLLATALREVGAEVSGRQGDMLALHVDAVTARLSCRELSAGALRPADLKTASLLPAMAALRCRHAVDLAVSAAGAKQRVHEAVAEAARWECAHRVGPAVGLVEGALQPADRQLGDVAASGSGGGGWVAVQLLAPLGGGAPAAVGAGARGEEVTARGQGSYQRVGKVTLRGVLDCRAYVHRREPAAAGVEAIKADIARSLQARLEVLVDAADMASAVIKDRVPKEATAAAPPDHPLLRRAGDGVPFAPLLPRRAVLTWPGGGGCYCDYLVEGEGEEDTMQRLRELVGEALVGGGAYACDEAPAAAAAAGGGAERSAARGGRASMLQGCDMVTLGAVGGALLAAAVGYTYLA
jgi:hypothetical protein